MVNGGVLISQDLSCAGQVSLAIALPILGACGLKPTVLPTAILSTHTGGFGDNTYLDLSDEMKLIFQHWHQVNLEFNALYLGYQGKKALEFWLNNFEQIKLKNNLVLIDPAMADHGKMYRGLDQDYVRQMRQLIHRATIITPNLTEAAFLLGKEKQENTLAVAQSLARELQEHFSVPNVIITGISLTNEKIAEVGVTQAESWSLIQSKQAGSFFGTGDIFASAFLASVMRHNSLKDSCSIAADFVAQAIINTPKQDPRLGPNYAAGLPNLVKQLKQRG